MSSEAETPKAGHAPIVISVDAMGGDRGPAPVIAGIAQWLVARVVGRLVYRVLSLSGNADWATALPPL